VAAGQLGRDGAGAGGDVEDPVAGAGAQAGGEEAVPARLLAQAQDRRPARVRRPGQAREQLLRLGLGGRGERQ
jgi:hypothetical protein